MSNELELHKEIAELKLQVNRLEARLKNLQGFCRTTMGQIPEFKGVALTKLQYLMEKGYIINGLSIQRPIEGSSDGSVQRGFIDQYGFVGWWSALPIIVPRS